MADTDTVMDFTAITGLGHVSTAGVGGVGVAIAGEHMVDIATEIMRQDHLLIRPK